MTDLLTSEFFQFAVLVALVDLVLSYLVGAGSDV